MVNVIRSKIKKIELLLFPCSLCAVILIHCVVLYLCYEQKDEDKLIETRRKAVTKKTIYQCVWQFIISGFPHPATIALPLPTASLRLPY